MDSSCSLVNKSCRYTSFVVFAVTMCFSPSSFVDARGFLFPPTNRKKDPRQRLDESFDPTICESVVKMFFSREPWRSCDVFNDSAFGRRTENNPREFLSSNPPPFSPFILSRTPRIDYTILMLLFRSSYLDFIRSYDEIIFYNCIVIRGIQISERETRFLNFHRIDL